MKEFFKNLFRKVVNCLFEDLLTDVIEVKHKLEFMRRIKQYGEEEVKRDGIDTAIALLDQVIKKYE